ncbi:MAG: YifB family Mg chelatase-like AAA ATPase [Lachnospiraceae bacterium]|nr:YifB family Mg chelatase-like AAA ATPase [Lachnospiraceae bacterium]
MYSEIQTYALQGLKAIPVRAEIDISSGMPMVSMVGSLGSEVRESRERVWAALRNVGLEVPANHITINLSPAELHKDGAAYDLPIAVGLLQALEYFPPEAAEGMLFLGELGLSGEIKPVRGTLPILRDAAARGIRECIVPAQNAAEGSVVPEMKVRGAEDILQVLHFLQGAGEEAIPAQVPPKEDDVASSRHQDIPDFSEVRGQQIAKRAALISAAGFHSLLMTGPPGAGKSMLAKRIPGILPPLGTDEALEVTSIYSVAGKLSPGESLIRERRFQAPHHSVSRAALIGGGRDARPGAITLAHRSVLFLDELPEFSRDSIDALREPLEEHRIRIDRAAYSAEYPADFLLVCAMNPCPCGYYPDRNRCKCTEPQLARYLGKVSGPILDRIDLCVELKAVELSEIASKAPSSGETSAQMREKVIAARQIQSDRYRGTPYRFNAELPSTAIERYCALGDAESAYLQTIYEKLGMSARSYHRTLRVARTIADLEGSDLITSAHLIEAVSYRPDRSYWR